MEYMTLVDLARLLSMTPSNLRAKLKKDKVLTKKAPVMTGAGVRLVRWVPKDYATKLVQVYEEAKANTDTKGS